MVKLHVKRGDESQFLYETATKVSLNDLIRDVTVVYNGRLKVKQIEDLIKHGATLPPQMQGRTEDQIKEQCLVDEWFETWKGTTKQSGEHLLIENKDPVGRRNGYAPNEKMAEVLTKTVAEAKSAMSNTSVPADCCLSLDRIYDTLDMLRGAVAAVFPSGLPQNDPIRCELENREDLHDTQAEQDVISLETAQLWWAGKELLPTKKLKDYIGSNEKTKIIVKLQKSGQGPPSREPSMTEEDRKMLMSHAYRKQEELKRLEEDEDDSHLDSPWADQRNLKRTFHGVQNVTWKPH